MNVNPLRILIVEDEKHDFQLARRMLDKSDLDCTVTWVQRGEEAISRLQTEPFDVVLIDFQLPGASGLDAFQQMVAQGLEVPTVFVTGGGNEKIAVEALKLGAQDYLVKDPAGEYLNLLPVIIRKARSQWETEQARRRAEAELAQKAADLEARNAELDAFAHTVAHEIKNPLSTIIGYGQFLESQVTSTNPVLNRALHTIVQNSYKIHNIINELLLLASVRETEIQLLPLDMLSIVGEAQRRLAEQLEESQGVVVLPETWPATLGYPPWLEEVWVNYLSNGLKYGGQPPRLEVTAHLQTDGLVRFAVKDNGPGITPEDQTRLFIPFVRLHQVKMRGHGLGLSIVRRIIEKCGGQVGVESQVGQGSTFWFTLPAYHPAPA